MDFFDDHPYTFDIAEFEKIAEFYGPEKPLLFTEWGGRELGQSEYIMPNTVDLLLTMTQKDTLAGHAFWSWQDLPQFTRIDMEMQDGILESGVVTEDREPRSSFTRSWRVLYAGRRHVDLPVSEAPLTTPLRPHAVDAAQPVHSRGPDARSPPTNAARKPGRISNGGWRNTTRPRPSWGTTGRAWASGSCCGNRATSRSWARASRCRRWMAGCVPSS